MEIKDLEYTDGVINLDKYGKYATQVINGACGAKYIFDIDGQKYFFKGNFTQSAAVEDFEEAVEVEIRQDIIESFASSMLRSVGVHDAVNYRLAEFNGERGCVSKDFKTPETLREFPLYDIMILNFYNDLQNYPYPITTRFSKEEERVFLHRTQKAEKMFYLFNVEDILEQLDKFTQTYNLSYDRDEIKKFLNKMCVVDYFLCNDDRNWQNITFLMQNNGTTTPQLVNAPIYDNGYALGTWYIDNIMSDERKSGDVIALLGFNDVDPRDLNGWHPQLIHDNIRANKTLQNNGVLAIDIADLARKDKDIKDLVDKFVKFDIDKKLDEFEFFNDIEVPEKYRDMMSKIYKLRVEHYSKRDRKLHKLLDKNAKEM